MHTLYIQKDNVVLNDLDTELRAIFSDKISGVSFSISEKLRIHFYDEYTPTDEVTAQAIVDAHDPVFLTATRDGDNVTVTAEKPHNVDAATELTFTIDGQSAPAATALVADVASAVFISADPIEIGIAENYPHEKVVA